MKILFECSGIVPGKHCGIENFIYSLVRGFNSSCQSDEIYMNINPGLKTEFNKVLPEARVVYLEDFKQSHNQKIYTNNWLVNYFVRGMRRLGLKSIISGFDVPRNEWCKQCEEAVDVIFYPFWMESFYFKKPVVMVIHDFRHFTHGKNVDKNVKIIKEHPAYCLVTSWPDPYQHMLELFPERKSTSFMIPFQFEPMPKEDEISKYQIPRLFIYASSNGADKNHENLILALGILKKRGIEPVRVICPGTQIAERAKVLDELIRKEDVSDWIQFLGFVPREHVKWLYSICFGVITTTKYEAFSGTVMEAFQYAKPVACSRIPSLTSVIDTNDIAVRYFDPDNSEEIADAITEVIENPEPYKKGALHARRVFSKITPETTALKYRDVFVLACSKAYIQ